MEQEYNFFNENLKRIQIKIPEDCVARYQIDKVAKKVAKEGFPFEDEIKRIVLKSKNFKNTTLYQVFS